MVKYLFVCAVFGGGALDSGAAEYQRATEGGDVVKNKTYPRAKTIELNVPNVGAMLNQSYVNTFLLNGGIVYNMNEEWGFGADVTMGINSDREERDCIERFYNDPNDRVRDNCGEPESLRSDPNGYANYGPAYVPIRELKYIATANAVWTPVYGKQLVLMSATSYFDLFVEAGLGVAVSDFYPKSVLLRDGRKSRGQFNQDGSQPNPKIGADASQTNLYGIEGCPEVENQSNVLLNLGVGQKFHFLRHAHVSLSLRNMTLLGTSSGFENLFVLYGGGGFRF